MGFNANVLKFDKNNTVEDFTFILSTKNYKHLGKINNIKRDTVNCVGNLNSANEISFEVYKTINGEAEEHWDEIVDLKSVYVKELNEYFEIKVTYNDALDEVKKIVGTSLCEAELGQTNIYNTEINTEADISRDNYVETKFYDEDNPKASLLHRVLSFAPHYKIKYVDSSLCNIQRSFSINGTTIYDFLTGECAEQFNCLFAFNSTDRSISVFDLYSTCIACGHRGAFNDICPECGSTDVVYFGEDTLIFVNKENLTDDVQFETDIDQMKNCFKLTAGDDIMTTAIIDQNPNGTAYIYTVPIEQRADMSEEFLQRFDAYNELYDSYTEEYQQLSEQINNLQNDIDKYTYYMMPEPVDDDEEETDTTISVSEKEAQKLTADNLSPIGLAKLTITTPISTINNAIKNYAGVFVNTSLVKVEVEESAFVYKGTETDGWNYGEWKGKLKVVCWSNKEDVVITEQMTIRVHDNYGDYCQQASLKAMTEVTKEDSVFDVLGIEDLDEFKSALELYCLNRLESFEKAIDSAIMALAELKQSVEDAEWYEELYVPYHDKLVACATEIEKRNATIEELKSQVESLQERKDEIKKTLNFEDYLGEELFLEFCSYKREQEYNNSNYTSDGLSDAELMERARKFFDVASKELFKSANRQSRISTSLHNLLVMPEFKELVKNFALGNFIRVQAGKDIYRLRLISYTINFSDLSRIEVEFSDMTKTANGLSDVQSILSSAQSMAKSYNTVAKQAEKGQTANSTFDQMFQDGLNSALININNNNNQEVTIDNNGILAKSYDDIENSYSPEQMRITHNIICFTDNNWRSCKAALGKHNYYKFVNGEIGQYTAYGLTSDFVTSGVVNGSQIIGGEVYSTNYSSTEGSYMNLEDGSFNFGHKIIYDAPSHKMTLKGVDIEWSSSTTPEIDDIEGLDETLTTQSASITANANAITSEVTRAKNAESSLSSSITQTANSIISTVSATYETKGDATSKYNTLSTSITQTANSIESKVSKTDYNGKELVSLINQTAEAVSINANKINLNGAVTANNYFKINTDGSMEATNGIFTGTVNADDGKIGGWEIGETTLSSVGDENKIILDPNSGIKQTGTSVVFEGEEVKINNWELSNSGTAAFRGNLYVANIGKIADGDKKGKIIARGFKTHLKNGVFNDAHEVVIRGLDPGEESSGAIFIRKNHSDLESRPGDYDNDTGHDYPFIIDGTGNLSIGQRTPKNKYDGWNFTVNSETGTLNIGKDKFIVDGSTGNTTVKGKLTIEGETTLGKSGVTTKINNATCTNLTINSGSISLKDSNNKQTFLVSSNGNLNVGNGKFTVSGSSGDVTIGGICTISGSCTASNINATGGQIGGWYIGSGTDNNGALTGSLGNSSQYMTLYPNGCIISGKTYYILIFAPGGIRKGLTIDGWQTF